jgi:hypothetical protein
LHYLLIYYTCDINICVENGSWPTYVMHSVLPPEPGVTPTQVLNDNGKPPRALFRLTSKDKIEVMGWMEKNKFPDGYDVGLK